MWRFTLHKDCERDRVAELLFLDIPVNFARHKTRHPFHDGRKHAQSMPHAMWQLRAPGTSAAISVAGKQEAKALKVLTSTNRVPSMWGNLECRSAALMRG